MADSETVQKYVIAPIALLLLTMLLTTTDGKPERRGAFTGRDLMAGVVVLMSLGVVGSYLKDD